MKKEVIKEIYITTFYTKNLDLYANINYFEDWISKTQFKIEYFVVCQT